MHNVVVLRGIVLGLVVPVLLAAAGLGAAPASAHAALVSSDPADGTTLAAAPTQITLTFNQNVGKPADVAIAAPDGTQVDVTGIRAVGPDLTATVADVDQRGTYRASFRIVSSDGHPVTGTVTYDVTAGRAVTAATPTDTDQESFVHRHSSHLFWGILAAVVALGLLLAPLRRRNDPDAA
ncbi:copper resistance CopC family protein [Aeromicrobium wangtongii]|uniref:Copper resistance protein CopC n=1 Tax=Aeromicrobium wangtongii TaxID=2969247 RepID=A0ABY5M522_9ACTN|nr:copper resistance CopC family protein [Aeromicrobium wangtongii]MCD9198117.1 copper resistance protein CopC [Aeromicrobium wangtongii]UUP12156.1 copper resistance protein CopC [Aeromicrobium wangtongii]